MNKKFCYLLAFLMAAIVCASFVSCSSDDDEGSGGLTSLLIGTWEIAKEPPYYEGDEVTYNFKSDGTGYLIWYMDGRGDFKWTFNEETMMIRFQFREQDGSYEDDGEEEHVQKLTSTELVLSEGYNHYVAYKKR